MITIRAAEQTEIDQLAQVWFDAWNDAHAHLVPVELVRLRTLESFRKRMQRELPNVRVAGDPGKVKCNETMRKTNYGSESRHQSD